jgi:hypothetical protein
MTYMPINRPYREDTTLDDIIKDGWARGFALSQTIYEAKQMGFTITVEELRTQWRALDDQFEKDLESFI